MMEGEGAMRSSASIYLLWLADVLALASNDLARS